MHKWQLDSNKLRYLRSKTAIQSYLKWALTSDLLIDTSFDLLGAYMPAHRPATANK